MYAFEFAFLAIMVAAIVGAYWLEALLPLEDRPADLVHTGRNLVIWCMAFLLADILVGEIWLDLPSQLEQKPYGVFYWLSLPELLLLPLGVIVIDLADYLYHRLSHAWPPLWRLHRVHHSDNALDVSTTLRAHPLELVLSNFWKFGVALAFGIPLWVIALRELIIWPLIFLQHANVDLPEKLEKGLATVFVTPTLHRHHHSIIREQHDSNYGEGLILWDKSFGSFQQPLAGRPEEYGVEGLSDSRWQTLVGMLATPFSRS